MVLNANDLLGWNDFPKGLRVLLLGDDSSSAAEIRSKLEEMDYIVSTFYNENEALSAISSSVEGFHVALVEVNTDNSEGRFMFLETAKDLPTIMTSDMHCLNTMMKCIALGAVEFLRKPLSEEKIRNIWQHVVHKAFNAGGKDLSESLKPVKESLTCMLQLQLEIGESDNISVKKDYDTQIQENIQEMSAGSDKYPAPSTPQIKRGVRLPNDGDCQDQTNMLTDKESMEQDGESKSVETTFGDSVAETIVQMSPPQGLGEADIREEDELANGCKDKSNVCGSLNKGSPNNCCSDSKRHNKASRLRNSSCFKANQKKMKVDWTSELHKKFVQAVEQLGVDQAIPSKILEVMKVEGLTRHNVASHLQKYRMQQRHILPKERSYYPRKPVMVFPPYHSTRALPGGQVYPAWVPPSNYPTGVQMWGSPCYPPWQSAESWHWKPYPTMHADTWGCPMMPPLVGPCPPFPQNASQFQSSDTMYNCHLPQNTFDSLPAEEVIDKVVKEAISKPWLPLPLGLKPPSTESVLTELSKQGISSIPPRTRSTHFR